MNFDDPAAFMGDFGVPCLALPEGGGQAVPFTGMLDQPSALLSMGLTAAHSQQYELRYITAKVTLKRDQAVTVSGVAYTVREAPRQVGDGAFSTVMLSRT